MTLSNMDMQSSIADELVAFANRLAQDNPDADPWEIADGLLSGAVHWWLYANASRPTARSGYRYVRGRRLLVIDRRAERVEMTPRSVEAALRCRTDSRVRTG